MLCCMTYHEESTFISDTPAMAKGASDAGVFPAIAVIGDSTFTHSGMTGLLDAVNDRANITVVISDNLTTAMTGGQDSAGTNKFEAICLGLGVEPEHVRVVVPLPKNMEEITRTIREEIEYKGDVYKRQDKTFLFGGNYLNTHPLSTHFRSREVGYTFNYYINITMFPWLEVSYICTLVHADHGSAYFPEQSWGKFTNQDRAFSARLRLWKEGWWKEWTPQIVDVYKRQVYRCLKNE